MSASCLPLRPEVRQTEVRGVWELCEPLLVLDGARHWWIPQGFRCDYASVPRLTRFWTQTTDLGTAGPFSHDRLYRTGGWVQATDGTLLRYTRAEADRLFLALMHAEGVPMWRRVPAYHGVRLFGDASWQDSAEMDRAA